jgi:hypothetical protein
VAQGVDDLRAALEAQRDACAEVLRRKEELAAELRTALKEKDNQYVGRPLPRATASPSFHRFFIKQLFCLLCLTHFFLFLFFLIFVSFTNNSLLRSVVLFSSLSQTILSFALLCYFRLFHKQFILSFALLCYFLSFTFAVVV